MTDKENPIRHELQLVAVVQVAHPTGHKTGIPPIELLATTSDGAVLQLPSALT